MKTKKIFAALLTLGLSVSLTAMPTLAEDKKTFVFWRYHI